MGEYLQQALEFYIYTEIAQKFELEKQKAQLATAFNQQ